MLIRSGFLHKSCILCCCFFGLKDDGFIKATKLTTIVIASFASFPCYWAWPHVYRLCTCEIFCSDLSWISLSHSLFLWCDDNASWISCLEHCWISVMQFFWDSCHSDLCVYSMYDQRIYMGCLVYHDRKSNINNDMLIIWFIETGWFLFLVIVCCWLHTTHTIPQPLIISCILFFHLLLCNLAIIWIISLLWNIATCWILGV